jgi:hypothetical protein
MRPKIINNEVSALKTSHSRRQRGCLGNFEPAQRQNSLWQSHYHIGCKIGDLTTHNNARQRMTTYKTDTTFDTTFL